MLIVESNIEYIYRSSFVRFLSVERVLAVLIAIETPHQVITVIITRAINHLTIFPLSVYRYHQHIYQPRSPSFGRQKRLYLICEYLLFCYRLVLGTIVLVVMAKEMRRR